MGTVLQWTGWMGPIRQSWIPVMKTNNDSFLNATNYYSKMCNIWVYDYNRMLGL